MSVPTNTVQEVRKSTREDFVDTCWNVDPIATPCLSRARRSKATSTKHDWEVDIIPTQNASNLQIQGDDATADSQNDVGRIENVTGISRKVIQISGTTQAVKAAGGVNRMGYQVTRNIKALKIDIEGVILKNVAQTAPNGSTAGVPAGLPAYLTRNVVKGSGGTVPSGGNIVTLATGKSFGLGTGTKGDGSQTAITITQFQSLMALAYTGCGKSLQTLVVATSNKQIISGFAPTGATRFVQTDTGSRETLDTAIDYVKHDFGITEIIPDLFLPDASSCFGFRWDYFAVAWLRQFETEPLAKTGDSDRKMVICEYTPEVRNEHALGAIYDTTGSN